MIKDIYPFPLVGWLVILAVLFFYPTQHRTIRYGILLVWLFFGAGGAGEVPLSRIASPCEQPILLLHKVLGPGPSQTSRVASKYVPAFVLWIELPLHLGFGHPNIYISAAAFIIVFLLQELSSREYGRQLIDQ
ncbi:hypothetical protein F5884DRAFT_788511 [Xylogone sp. PMI_703]|nr:hypothetical protein F5884DRAFT_788511 [Xylogone sp. PMI_703]